MAKVMKREIKFRGKAKLDGKWWFGNLVPKDTRGRTQINNPEHGGCFDIDSETVGQFTGLRDKNGKEIYEGDIVLWERKKVHIEGRPLQDFSDVCKIYYDDQLHAFRYWYKITCGSASGLLTFNDDRAESSSIEVIGNIYDNPELLKEE